MEIDKDKKLEIFDKKLLSDEEIDSIKKELNEATEYVKRIGYTNDEHLRKIEDNSGEVAKIRGGIINTMVDFEHFLCIFLSRYFCDMDKSIEFYEHILSQDFFTMKQKIELFRKIGYHKQEKYKGKYDGLSGIMFKLNELRNLVAHGTRYHFTKPKLGYPYSGKAIDFDSSLAKKFRNAFDQAHYSLYLLNEDLEKEKFEKKYGTETEE